MNECKVYRIEVEIQPSWLKRHFIHIPVRWRSLFPHINGITRLEIMTDLYPNRPTYTTFYYGRSRGMGIRSFGLRDWFRKHQELKVRDVLAIEVRGTGTIKEYRLLSPGENRGD